MKDGTAAPLRPNRREESREGRRNGPSVFARSFRGGFGPRQDKRLGGWATPGRSEARLSGGRRLTAGPLGGTLGPACGTGGGAVGLWARAARLAPESTAGRAGGRPRKGLAALLSDPSGSGPAREQQPPGEGPSCVCSRGRAWADGRGPGASINLDQFPRPQRPSLPRGSEVAAGIA